MRRAVGDIAQARVPVIVEIGGSEYRLEAIWVGQGWPSNLDALDDVPSPWPRRLVVAARRFSPGALERLSELDANWVDETGRAHIEGPDGFFVLREPLIEEKRPDRKFRWSPSAEQIGEFLLTHAGDAVNAHEIAMQTGWSHAQISNVLRQFDAQSWTQKSGASRGRYARRRVAEPGALLEAWAEFAGGVERDRVLTHRVVRDPMTFLHDDLAPALAETFPWAASGWAGLELAAPFTTAVPVLHIYVAEAALVDGHLRGVMASLRLREVDEGARVEFWGAAPTVLALATEARGLPVVSPPRLYGDLLALGGRGEDAAAHIREELIGF